MSKHYLRVAKLLAILVFILSSAVGFGQGSFVWTGEQDADWNNPQNWRDHNFQHNLPTPGSTATIPADLSGHQPVISSSQVIDYVVQNLKLLTIAAGAHVETQSLFINFSGGCIAVHGALVNVGTIAFDNDGKLDNFGFFENQGTLDNAGQAAITNHPGAHWRSLGNVINYGPITNKGFWEIFAIVNNFGTTTNEGLVSNHGTFENFPCATLIQNADNTFGGDVWNLGVAYQLLGFLNATNMGGVVLFKLSENPKPTMRCKDATVQLGPDGTLTIGPELVNDGSSADYCFITQFEVNPKHFDCSHVGQNVVTLTATDALGNSASCQAVVTILENGCEPDLNCPPEVSNLLLCLDDDDDDEVQVSGQLPASDPNGDPLTFNPTPLYGPFLGSVTIHPDGSFTYKADDDDDDEADVFAYEVCDGKADACSSGCSRGIVIIQRDDCEDDDEDDKGDCCEAGGKPQVLTLRYTGEDCSASDHDQDPEKATCSGDPHFASNVRIVASEKQDGSGKVWFDGIVALGSTFQVDSKTNGESRLKSNTYLNIFDLNGNHLQRVQMHTSCSQPLDVGDRFGSLLLEGILKDNGEACGEGGSGSGNGTSGNGSADCCEEGEKPVALTMQYTGEGCGATHHSQDDEKVSCSGDPALAGTVQIVASEKENPFDGDVYFNGMVNLGESFTLAAANAGEDKLRSNTWVSIYDTNGKLLQRVQFHTSCSQPLLIGDQFGALLLEDILFKDGSSCSGQPPAVPECECEGGIATLGLRYEGNVPVSIEAWKKKDKKDKNRLGKYTGVQAQEVVFFSGAAQGKDKLGKFYFSVDGGKLEEIHVSCSQDILGQKFGDFRVVFQADKEGNLCQLPQPDCEEFIAQCLGGGQGLVMREVFDFFAEKNALAVDLHWLSNRGYFTDYFVLERATDGIHFEELARVNGFSESLETEVFQWVDAHPATGANFYRLKQVFTDGKVQFSPIRLVFFEQDLESIRLFPNPTREVLWVSLRPFLGERVQLRLVDLQGRLLHHSEVEAAGEQPHELHLPALRAGLYFLQIEGENRRPVTKKVLVQH